MKEGEGRRGGGGALLWGAVPWQAIGGSGPLPGHLEEKKPNVHTCMRRDRSRSTSASSRCLALSSASTLGSCAKRVGWVGWGGCL